MNLEKIKRYLTKNTLLMVLVVFSSVAIYTGFNLRSKLLLTRSELLSSKSLYSIVEKEKSRLDSLARVYVQSIKDRDVIIRDKEKKIAGQEKIIAVLKDSLKHNLDDVSTVTVDSSYKYINQRVKPIAEQKYPFDSLQVKTIHYTFVERDGLFNITKGLDSLVVDLRLLSSTKDNQILELNSLNNVYISQKDILKKENEAYKIQVVGLNKAVKQQKLLKTLSNGTALGFAGYIIIHSLAK